MAKKRKEPELYIRVLPQSKGLGISTGAGAYLLGYNEVNVYEKGGVIALEAVRRGMYHISVETGRMRAILSNKHLALYVREKFNCGDGARLPAWTGLQGGVVFFGGFQPESEAPAGLDESWTALALDYNRRVGGWSYVHDNWIEFNQQVLDGMKTRFFAFQSGAVTVLCPDENGHLTLTPRRRSGKPLLVSHALANYLREKYGATGQGLRLRAQSTAVGGVLLGDDEDKLPHVDLNRLEPIELDETELRFLNMINKKGFYLSAQAWAALDNCQSVSVYAHENWLALKAESHRCGDRQIGSSGYTKSLHSAVVAAFLQRTYPGVAKFYLLSHGPLWLLWPQPSSLERPPRPEMFSRIQLDVHKRHDRLERSAARQRKKEPPKTHDWVSTMAGDLRACAEG